MKTKKDTGNVAAILSPKTEIFKFFEKEPRDSDELITKILRLAKKYIVRMHLIQDAYTYLAIWRERSQWLWLDSRVPRVPKSPSRFNVSAYSSYNFKVVVHFKVITVMKINRVYVYHAHCVTREKHDRICSWNWGRYAVGNRSIIGRWWDFKGKSIYHGLYRSKNGKKIRP